MILLVFHLLHYPLLSFVVVVGAGADDIKSHTVTANCVRWLKQGSFMYFAMLQKGDMALWLTWGQWMSRDNLTWPLSLLLLRIIQIHHFLSWIMCCPFWSPAGTSAPIKTDLSWQTFFSNIFRSEWVYHNTYLDPLRNLINIKMMMMWLCWRMWFLG